MVKVVVDESVAIANERPLQGFLLGISGHTHTTLEKKVMARVIYCERWMQKRHSAKFILSAHIPMGRSSVFIFQYFFRFLHCVQRNSNGSLFHYTSKFLYSNFTTKMCVLVVNLNSCSKIIVWKKCDTIRDELRLAHISH